MSYDFWMGVGGGFSLGWSAAAVTFIVLKRRFG